MTASVTHSRDELGAALSDAGDRTVLVPTMGAIHEGHLALVRTAHEHGDTVVASVFVNPTQFAPGEDFERYPRTLERDTELLGAAGVDVVFAPDVDTVYPPGVGDITIDPGPLGRILEGASRPTHFRGVLTVVAKLFALVRPDAATFGEKDYQQLVLVRRMARALHTGIDVVATPTVREPDGLAKSSRNVYLGAAERTTVLALSRALRAGNDARAGGASAVTSAARAVLGGADGIELDYLALADAELGEPVPGEPARLLVAARVGATRLIDNIGFDLPQTAEDTR